VEENKSTTMLLLQEASVLSADETLNGKKKVTTDPVELGLAGK
jgi:hypothetical protein